MPQKIKKYDLVKEMEDVKSLMSHLEDEYRKANVSEKYYKELREKYAKKLNDIENKLDIKKEKVESVKPMDIAEPKSAEVVKEDKPKIGILGKLIKRKEKTPEIKPEETKTSENPKDEIEVGEVEEMTPEVIEKLAQQVAEQSGATGTASGVETEETPVEEESRKDVEIEKLKVMIDTIRDAKRVTDESIQSLSESIGEIRSMAFQVDGSLRELALKVEKIDSDVSEIKPREIDKKFREFNSTLEKQQMVIEKFSKKSEDLAAKVNDIYNMMKEVGGIENLVNLTKNLKKKIDDIKELVRYSERVGSKTEKIFIELNKSLEDFVSYKAKQEALDDLSNDILKSIDGINVKFEGYVTKTDLDKFKEELNVIENQIQNINKALPMVELKLPETLISLKKEKNDIATFLDYLEEQFKTNKISRQEYETIKESNKKKLVEIEEKLKSEWEKVEKLLKPAEKKEGEITIPAAEGEKIEMTEGVKEEKSQDVSEEGEKPEDISQEEEEPKEIVEAKKPRKKRKEKEVVEENKEETKDEVEESTEENQEEVSEVEVPKEEKKEETPEIPEEVKKEEMIEEEKPKKKINKALSSKKKPKHKVVIKKKKIVKKVENEVSRKKKILGQLKKMRV